MKRNVIWQTQAVITGNKEDRNGWQVSLQCNNRQNARQKEHRCLSLRDVSSASQAWVKYAFEVAELRRLVVCPHKANIASVRVLEKLGFRIEDDWLEPESVLAFLENSKAAA